jgi:fluoride ion exporter CrcB/FEX
MSSAGTSPMNPDTHRDADVAPELAPLHLEDRPDGPGAAMMISAGFGIFVLGFLTILSEASESANTWLSSWDWTQGVGALAGKTTIASLAYLGSLVLLWAIWRKSDIYLKGAFYIGLALGVVGLIATFPPVFLWFAP